MDSWMDLGNQIWRPPPPNLIAAFLLGWHSIYGRLDGFRQANLAASAAKFDCGFHLCCILDILFVWTDHRPTDHYPPLNNHYPPLNNHCPLLSNHCPPRSTAIHHYPTLSTTIHHYTTTISTTIHHSPPLSTTIPPLFPPLTTTIHDQTPPYDQYTPLSTSQQIQNKSPVEVT